MTKSQSPAASQDAILPGVALMLAFCVLAPLLDVASKLAAQSHVPVGQITAARFVVQAALMLPVVLVMRLPFSITPRMAGFVALRAGFLLLSTFSFISGIAVMPIADALAIAFIEPFIILLIGGLFMGDAVGPRRIAACGVGFLGAMMVIQPSLAHFGLVALWPLGTAVFFAAYMVVTRFMSTGIHPVTMQLHTSIAGMIMIAPIIWAAEGSGVAALDPVWPRGLAWLWLFGVGFWAAVSHICMTYALKFAPSTTLAPLHYSEIVAAVILGYVVFHDFPNWLTCAGIVVIVGSGLYVIQGERLQARAMRAPAP